MNYKINATWDHQIMRPSGGVDIFSIELWVTSTPNDVHKLTGFVTQEQLDDLKQKLNVEEVSF